MRIAFIFITGRCGNSAALSVNLPLEMVCASVLTRRPISVVGEIRATRFDGGTVSEWGKPGAHRAFLIWGELQVGALHVLLGGAAQPYPKRLPVYFASGGSMTASGIPPGPFGFGRRRFCRLSRLRFMLGTYHPNGEANDGQQHSNYEESGDVVHWQN